MADFSNVDALIQAGQYDAAWQAAMAQGIGAADIASHVNSNYGTNWTPQALIQEFAPSYASTYTPAPAPTPTPAPAPAPTPVATPTTTQTAAPTGMLAAENQVLTKEQLDQLIANRYQGFEGQWGINPQATTYEDLNGNIHTQNATAALPTGNGTIGLFEIQPQADGTYKLVSGGIQGTPASVEQQIRTIDAKQNADMNTGMTIAALAAAGAGMYGSGMFGGAGAAAGGGTTASSMLAADTQALLAAGFTPAEVAGGLAGLGSTAEISAVLTAAGIDATTAATLASNVVANVAAGNTGSLIAGSQALPGTIPAASGMLTPPVPPGTPPSGTVPPPVPPPGGTPTPLPGPGGVAPPPGFTWDPILKTFVPIAAQVIATDQQNKANQETQDKNNAITEKAMQNAQFKPYGSRFATTTPTYKDGVFTGFNTQRDPYLAHQQNLILGMGNKTLDQYRQAYDDSQMLGAGGRRAMELGAGYLQQTPEAQAADWMAKQQGLLAPAREQAFSTVQNKLAQQGRLGLSTGGTSTTMATNPEMAAYQNAIQQENLRLASQATEQGRAQAQFGTGLMGTGGDLFKQMYGMQTAAYAPYAQTLTGAQNLEGLFQMPEDRSMLAAGKNVPSSNLLAQQQQPYQTSPWASLLTGGVNAYQQYQNRPTTQQPVTTQNPYVPVQQGDGMLAPYAPPDQNWTGYGENPWQY